MMSNESPYTPSARVIEGIVKAALQGNIYPPSSKQLRKKLGEQEGFSENNTILGAGSTELIDLVIRSFVAPGEEVLLSVPTFSMYEARTRTVGGLPVLVPMTPDAEFDVTSLISSITERTKVIFICTPNNPTGNHIQESSLRRILNLGIPTVIDEAYYEFSNSPESLAYLIEEFPNAIVLRTFSKAFGLAGIRLGYAFANPTVIRIFERVKLPWNISSLTLAAAIAILDDVEEQFGRLKRLRKAREELSRELRTIPGVHILPSEGNFVLIDLADFHVASKVIADQLLERGFLVRTLSCHHADRSMIRITIGTEEQNLECAAALRLLLESEEVLSFKKLPLIRAQRDSMLLN